MFDQQAFVEAVGIAATTIAQASIASSQGGPSNLQRFREQHPSTFTVAPLSRPDPLGWIRTESRMPLKSLHHSKSYLCGSDYKIGQAHKRLHLTKTIYNEGIQAFSK